MEIWQKQRHQPGMKRMLKRNEGGAPQCGHHTAHNRINTNPLLVATKDFDRSQGILVRLLGICVG